MRQQAAQHKIAAEIAKNSKPEILIPSFMKQWSTLGCLKHGKQKLPISLLNCHKYYYI
jgi:hypothetical protein